MSEDYRKVFINNFCMEDTELLDIQSICDEQNITPMEYIEKAVNFYLFIQKRIARGAKVYVSDLKYVNTINEIIL